MIEELEYKGWNALKLSTDKVDLVIPVEIGPRILSASLRNGGTNLFANVAEEMGGWGEDEWMIRGGHRLWTAPEHPDRSYAPDNDPIEVVRLGDSGLELTPKPEEKTGIQKTVRIEAIGPSSFRVSHTLANIGVWPVECAAWALSVMAHGGYAVLPLPPRGEHPRDLLPNTTIIPWTYTDLSLPVWQFRDGYIGMDVSRSTVPQKLGLSYFPGWAAYWQEGGTFAKYAVVDPLARYPDCGSSFETFCNDWMIELETLSPLQILEPGKSVTHVEYWGFFSNLPKPESREVYGGAFRPAIDSWLASLPE